MVQLGREDRRRPKSRACRFARVLLTALVVAFLVSTVLITLRIRRLGSSFMAGRFDLRFLRPRFVPAPAPNTTLWAIGGLSSEISPGELVKERALVSRESVEHWAPSSPPPLDLDPAALSASASASPWSVAAALKGQWSYAFESSTEADIVEALPDSLLELQRRLVVGIALGVHSGNTNYTGLGLASLPIFSTLIPTFLPTAQPHRVYRFYFAYDEDDPLFSDDAIRASAHNEAHRLVAEENSSRRRHRRFQQGSGSVRSRVADASSVTGAIDGSALLISFHWIKCGYSGSPAWAHSDAVMTAFAEGADYVYRTNDDSAFPVVKAWCDHFIHDLRNRHPVPNLGVVGPYSNHPAGIVTHEFVHRTHAAIFGFHYPRSLPDWSSDDWVNHVYGAFGLLSKRDDIPVDHRLFPRRYRNRNRDWRLIRLNEELPLGVERIRKWASTHLDVQLPKPVLKEVECC